MREGRGHRRGAGAHRGRRMGDRADAHVDAGIREGGAVPRARPGARTSTIQTMAARRRPLVRVPHSSGEPTALTCDEARAIIDQVRAGLAYTPEPVKPGLRGLRGGLARSARPPLARRTRRRRHRRSARSRPICSRTSRASESATVPRRKRPAPCSRAGRTTSAPRSTRDGPRLGTRPASSCARGDPGRDVGARGGGGARPSRRRLRDRAWLRGQALRGTKRAVASSRRSAGWLGEGRPRLRSARLRPPRRPARRVGPVRRGRASTRSTSRVAPAVAPLGLRDPHRHRREDHGESPTPPLVRTTSSSRSRTWPPRGCRSSRSISSASRRTIRRRR